MFQDNIVNSSFISFGLITIILGWITNTIETYLPVFITQIIRSGKIRHKGKQNILVSLLDVPKSWITHIHTFALVWSLLGLVLMLYCLMTASAAPDCVVEFLDYVAGGKDRKIYVNSSVGLLTLAMITMQCVRRFYETNSIQIFSSQCKFNVFHYIVGYLHYFGIVIALLANTEGFVRETAPSIFSLWDISLLQYFGCFIFHFSWCQQHRSYMILVNLRKDEDGNMVTEKYLLPQGGFFEFISSPHIFFEILMYIAICGIIPNCPTWWCIVFWVVASQTQIAWLTHKWYKENFKFYPRRRNAIIPFIL